MSSSMSVSVVPAITKRNPDVDLFDPSNAALLLSLTSKKHRQRLMTNGGVGGSVVLGNHTSTSSFASPTSFAHQQLSKLGWTPGTSIGRDGAAMPQQGIQIAMRRDDDTGGLGHGGNGSTTASGGDGTSTEWWKDALGSTLARLVSSAGSADSKKDKKKDKKEKKKRRRDEPDDDNNGEAPNSSQPSLHGNVRHYTDEELFVLAGQSRFGMRSAPKSRQLAKWKRANDEFRNVPRPSEVGANDSDGDSPAISETELPTLACDAAKDSTKKKLRKDTKKSRRKEACATASAAVVTDEPPSSLSAAAAENGTESSREEGTAAKKKSKKDKKKSRESKEGERRIKKRRKVEVNE